MLKKSTEGVLKYSKDENPLLCNEYELEGFCLVVEWPYIRAVPPFMRGYVGAYRTAEHAYQAMRACDYESAMQMEIGGTFDDYSVLERWPSTDDDAKTESIRGTVDEGQSMTGALAKMASRVHCSRAKAVWGLQLGRRWDEGDSNLLWEVILKAKFPLTSLQAEALIASGDALIVNSKPQSSNVNAVSVEYGCYDTESGQVVGRNMGGRRLMTLRADLQDEWVSFWKAAQMGAQEEDGAATEDDCVVMDELMSL
jgi:predicted NAD-dependent protein-ADP-ribosyltransferase YbiA (DUF1768 family)